MAENTTQMLLTLVSMLADAQIKTWLFGGWAEELLGLRPPGAHRDIDLLYPAQDFGLLDDFLLTQSDVEEVRPKRFLHKRAFRWQGVLVEIFLVSPDPTGCITDFFGTYQFSWPQDTFSHPALLPGGKYSIASPTALGLYREKHRSIEQAYQQHVAYSGKT